MHYCFGYSVDDNEIGVFPQASCLNQSVAHEIRSFVNYKNIPVLEFELRSKANITDVISQAAISSRGFLVNDKVKKILHNLHLCDAQFLKANVWFKGELYHYWWFQVFGTEVIDLLDYKNSLFFRTEYTYREDSISLDSKEHFIRLKKRDTQSAFGVDLEKAIFNKPIDEMYDVFTLWLYSREIFLSAKLKDVFMANNISGIRFESTSIFEK